MDAVKKGAKVISKQSGMVEGMPTRNYLYPTVIDHVAKDALVNIEEIIWTIDCTCPL